MKLHKAVLRDFFAESDPDDPDAWFGSIDGKTYLPVTKEPTDAEQIVPLLDQGIVYDRRHLVLHGAEFV